MDMFGMMGEMMGNVVSSYVNQFEHEVTTVMNETCVCTVLHLTFYLHFINFFL